MEPIKLIAIKKLNEEVFYQRTIDLIYVNICRQPDIIDTDVVLGTDDMAKKKVSSSDLIWMFHQKLEAYSDQPFHGVSLAIIRSGNGDWEVVTQRRLPKRDPDIASRIRAIEKGLRKQYTLVAD